MGNNKLDAASFFGNSVPIPALQQNEYGGTIGGPVILPHYNGSDKTFFFFSHSGFQLRGGVPEVLPMRPAARGLSG